jgi:solute carrier family 39 (zinc transporter), member 1/2/3
MAGAVEYEILTTRTSTDELPSQYTDCHSHSNELYAPNTACVDGEFTDRPLRYCVDPEGNDVAVRAEGVSSADSDPKEGTHESEDGASGGSEKPGELDCHFHAGVEYVFP